jgi:hypothetical protein
MDPKKLAVIYTFSQVAANAFLPVERKSGWAPRIGCLKTGQKAIILKRIPDDACLSGTKG